jgi:polyhydroxyalkanoate synthase
LHPALVRGLVTVAAPLHFDFTPQTGVLGPVIAELSRSGLLDAAPGNLPGSLLSTVSVMASPGLSAATGCSTAARLAGLALRSCSRVERWALDDCRSRASWSATSRSGSTPRRISGGTRKWVAAPPRRTGNRTLLIVADERRPIVPPQAILPFAQAAGAADKRLLWYEGDVGVALRHVGMLIGANAQRRLWPEILQWVLASQPA